MTEAVDSPVALAVSEVKTTKSLGVVALGELSHGLGRGPGRSVAQYDGQQGLHTDQVRSGQVRSGQVREEYEARLTKFICGASKPDIVKKMLSDIEQRDSFF